MDRKAMDVVGARVRSWAWSVGGIVRRVVAPVIDPMTATQETPAHDASRFVTTTRPLVKLPPTTTEPSSNSAIALTAPSRALATFVLNVAAAPV